LRPQAEKLEVLVEVGVIAIDRQGHLALVFNTTGM